MQIHVLSLRTLSMAVWLQLRLTNCANWLCISILMELGLRTMEIVAERSALEGARTVCYYLIRLDYPRYALPGFIHTF